jgi:pyruvate formate lyase activating enzyme
MPGVSTYELMPYHRLGRGKYADIGCEYAMADAEPIKASEIQSLRDTVASYGLSHSYRPQA